MSTPAPPGDELRSGGQPDFSLVLGGPLYQLWQRTHLTGDVLQLIHRRIVFLTVVAWAPLLALTVVEGHAWGNSVRLPFLQDVAPRGRSSTPPSPRRCDCATPCRRRSC
jgi:hypothetical protein